MTDSNRKEAQDELRQVIADAFAAHTLWTTDWNGVQLERFGPHRDLVSSPPSCKLQSFTKTGPYSQTQDVCFSGIPFLPRILTWSIEMILLPSARKPKNHHSSKLQLALHLWTWMIKQPSTVEQSVSNANTKLSGRSREIRHWRQTFTITISSITALGMLLVQHLLSETQMNRKRIRCVPALKYIVSLTEWAERHRLGPFHNSRDFEGNFQRLFKIDRRAFLFVEIGASLSHITRPQNQKQSDLMLSFKRHLYNSRNDGEKSARMTGYVISSKVFVRILLCADLFLPYPQPVLSYPQPVLCMRF